MEIQVRLCGVLQRYQPEHVTGLKGFVLQVSEGTTIADVARRLCMPAPYARSAFVNGALGSPDRLLSPCDRVVFLMPAGGGAS